MYRLERDHLQLLCNKINCDHQCYLFHEPLRCSTSSSNSLIKDQLQLTGENNDICSVSESETNSCEINDNKKLTVESGRKSGCSPESTVTLDDIIEIVKQKFSTENDDGPKEIKDVVFWTVDEKTANDTDEMKDVKNPEEIPMSNFENELLDSDDDSFVVGEPPSIITEEDDIDLLISAAKSSGNVPYNVGMRQSDRLDATSLEMDHNRCEKQMNFQDVGHRNNLKT
ncbi:unnamed protein product [Enterobius vermicularis]|uniref:Uncharacterized protein n=1 Tax=Enterobius vermicularis TaxID=51028 RepID=A0A0N4VPB0_ENTVE|nr:unnamed protein product [Enterobius vermicularis]